MGHDDLGAVDQFPANPHHSFWDTHRPRPPHPRDPHARAVGSDHRGWPRPVARPRDITLHAVRTSLRYASGLPTHRWQSGHARPLPEGGRRRRSRPRVLELAVRPGDHESDRRRRVRPAVLFAHGTARRRDRRWGSHPRDGKVALAVQRIRRHLRRRHRVPRGRGHDRRHRQHRARRDSLQHHRPQGQLLTARPSRAR